jgi:hypothetical protein
MLIEYEVFVVQVLFYTDRLETEGIKVLIALA